MRLETACEIALTHVRIPRYHHLKAILAANQDLFYLDSKKQQTERSNTGNTGYIRGAEYYGGSRK